MLANNCYQIQRFTHISWSWNSSVTRKHSADFMGGKCQLITQSRQDCITLGNERLSSSKITKEKNNLALWLTQSNSEKTHKPFLTSLNNPGVFTIQLHCLRLNQNAKIKDVQKCCTLLQTFKKDPTTHF